MLRLPVRPVVNQPWQSPPPRNPRHRHTCLRPSPTDHSQPKKVVSELPYLGTVAMIDRRSCECSLKMWRSGEAPSRCGKARSSRIGTNLTRGSRPAHHHQTINFRRSCLDIQCQQRVILCSHGHRCARTVAKVAYTSIAARNPLALRPPCSLIGLPNSTFRVSVVQLLGQHRPPDTRLPTEMTA